MLSWFFGFFWGGGSCLSSYLPCVLSSHHVIKVQSPSCVLNPTLLLICISIWVVIAQELYWAHLPHIFSIWYGAWQIELDQ
jgi:hypothetical protein